MDFFDLIIASPYKIIYKGKASRITCKTIEGEFSILVDFENFIISTLPYETIINGEDGEKKFNLEEGILKVENNKVYLCANLNKEAK